MSKQEWLVILPDAPGKLEERNKVRQSHLEGCQPYVAKGFLVLGGVSLDDPIKEGEALKMNGSCVMTAADTEEEVWDWVKQDVYYRTGVWDKEKIKVIPFKAAFRKAL